ncbi:MAG: AbgT family transporter [Phycisphaerae bacterium]|nr:AbgT family transporter [Phycisphaerae bacterium]
MADATVIRRGGLMDTFLRVIERGGNALPHPATLFLIFALVVVLMSEVVSRFGLEVTHPGTGELVRPVSLLNVAGLHRILTNLVTNFTGFAPLGTVLVALLGIGVAESSGLIATMMRLVVLSAPKGLLTPVMVFAGILSNMASEIGYVLLVPLAATIYQSAGRNPLTGMAAAFAGVSAGYSANLLLGTIDPLLAGLTQEAARILEPAREVSPACNYYFMFVSTFFLTLVGWWVTDRIVDRRLSGTTVGHAEPSAETSQASRRLTRDERRGMWFATFAAALFAAVLLWGTIPARGFLRDPEDFSLLHSPFMSGIVAFIFFGGAVCGLAYGIGARTIRNDAQVMDGMGKSMATLGGYLVLVFFAAQFVAFFNWTNLGIIVAVEGAEALRASGLGGPALMGCFVVLAAGLNLFMGSASAKWAIMAPVFVPMFMLLGYPAEMTQCAYRVGDSVSNIISPSMSYFALIITFFQRYQKDAGIGTLVATMLPYSVVFLIFWSILLVLWLFLGWPLGPGAPTT